MNVVLPIESDDVPEPHWLDLVMAEATVRGAELDRERAQYLLWNQTAYPFGAIDLVREQVSVAIGDVARKQRAKAEREKASGAAQTTPHEVKP